MQNSPSYIRSVNKLTSTLEPRASARPKRGSDPASLSHECLYRCRYCRTFLNRRKLRSGHVTAPSTKAVPNVSRSRQYRRCSKEFSKHRPPGPMLSMSRNVRLSVCLSVRLFVHVFTFEVPHFPKSDVQYF